MVEVDEIELDLELSIGGPFNKFKPELELDGLISDKDQNFQNNVVQKIDLNQQSEIKYEIQALKRGICYRVGESEPECNRVFKKEKMEFVNGGVSWMRQFQELASVKYMPLFLIGSENKNVGGIDGAVGFKGGDGKLKSNGSSSRCSSSVVSDYHSSSREDGGSSESHSQYSTNSSTEKIPLNNSKETSIKRNEVIASSNPTKRNNHNNVKKTKTMNLNEQPSTATDTIQNPIIKKPLPQMPYVSTKGNGPNGKTVNGFLYKYSKSDEVSIVCVCHGSTFSPAEFVQHAGGTDLSHPLKHITVNSSAFR